MLTHYALKQSFWAIKSALKKKSWIFAWKKKSPFR